jgi:ketosteroid isomerase-like protein
MLTVANCDLELLNSYGEEFEWAANSSQIAIPSSHDTRQWCRGGCVSRKRMNSLLITISYSRRRMTISWPAIYLVSVTLTVLAQEPSPADRAALQKAEDIYTAGVLHKDVKLLDSVWADTFVDTDEQGSITTKQEQLAKVAASKTQIKSLDVDQERVDWYGDTAVVTERFKLVYLLDGKEHAETGRATDVWVKQNGEWKCVAAHASTEPKK